MSHFDSTASSHVYIIAEAGVNHNGDRARAFELIDVAAEAGADAVKFQTFNAAKLAARSAPKAAYQLSSTDAAESQFEMLARLELPYELHLPLQEHAARRGIAFLSTAFDTDSLAFLEGIDMPFFKVPSGEMTNAPLLWRFARTGRPLVVSTGMATLSEVEQGLAVIAHALNAADEPADMEAVWELWSERAVRDSLRGKVTLLHCTSQYPTPVDQVNLRAMDTLADAFGLPVGYSDHTEGILVPVAAVARGACLIEKHFTTDRTLPGPDHQASIEPEQLRRMVAEIRAMQLVLGDSAKAPQRSEWNTRRAARQQVVAARDLPAGGAFLRDDLSTARCGAGLPAAELWRLVGAPRGKAYMAGEPIES